MEAFPAIPAENTQYYDFPQRFQQFVSQNRQRPKQERPICRDAFCLVFLIIALGGFFSYGGYLINLATKNEVPFTPLSQPMPLFPYDLIRTLVGIPLGMIGLSLALCIVILILLRCFPLAGIWTLVVLTLGALAGILIVSFYYGITPSGITVAVLLAILILCVICYSQRISSMATVLNTVTIFLESRTKIFLITFVMTILAIGFVVFWIISYYCMWALSQLNVTNDTDYTVGFVFWIILGVFWAFWFYYGMVYLVGAQTALWFYESPLTPIITPLKWLIQGNLGSVTFGSVLLALIKGLDIILSISLKGHRDRQNSVANAIFRCCVCMMQCCLRGFYTFIKILNNYNMIVISLTGESYLDSARLTGYILLKNFQMFQTIKLTSYFIYIGGLVTSSGIPTFIGIYLLKRQNMPYQAIIICGAIIFFLSMVIGLAIFSTVMEAVSAMFVIYCFQGSAAEIGHRMGRVLPRQNQLENYYRHTFPGEMNPQAHPSHMNEQHVSQQNLSNGNEAYNYQAKNYPQPYVDNQRFSQNVEMNRIANNNYSNNNNNRREYNEGPNFPLGYPL